jgi:hypothetical protein
MYAWSQALVLPYESSWSLFQKLTWLNLANPMVLLRDISSKQISADYSPRQPRSFIDTNWLVRGWPRTASLPPVTESGLEIQGELFRHGGQIYIGQFADRLLTGRLRICPECIQEGFHCIAHQIVGLRRCPLHEEELTSKCLACQRSLDVFGPCLSFHSFRCPWCGNSLLKDDFLPPKPKFVSLIVERVQPLISWINSFDDEPISWPSRSLGTFFRVAGDTSDVVTTLSSAALWCFHRLRPVTRATEWFEPESEGLFLARIDNAGGIDTWKRCGQGLWDRDLERRVNEALSFVGAVITEEQTAFAALLGERHMCCSDLKELLRRYTPEDREYLSSAPVYCERAQVFHLWNVYLKRGLEYFENSMHMGWSPRLDEAFRAVIRHDVVSSFYLSAQMIHSYRYEGDPTSKHIYGARWTGSMTLFSLNGEWSSWGRRHEPTASTLVFCLRDEAALDLLRCGRRHMVEAQAWRRAELIDALTNWAARRPTRRRR